MKNRIELYVLMLIITLILPHLIQATNPQQQLMLATTITAGDDEQTKREKFEQAIAKDALYENNKIPLHHASNAHVVRVMTYNINGFKNLRGMDALDKIGHVIDTLNPDILIVQEAAALDGAEDFNNSKAADFFRGKKYTSFSPSYYATPDRAWNGNVIVSKKELKNLNSFSFIAQDGTHIDGVVYADNKIGTKNANEYDNILHIYGTQLTSSSKNNESQGKDLADEIQGRIISEQKMRKEFKNFLIAGTFEGGRQSPAMQYLQDQNIFGVRDCFKEIDWKSPQFTHWSGKEVDFILLPPENAPYWSLNIAGCYVYYDATTGHLPIIMDIQVDAGNPNPTPEEELALDLTEFAQTVQALKNALTKV